MVRDYQRRFVITSAPMSTATPKCYNTDSVHCRNMLISMVAFMFRLQEINTLPARRYASAGNSDRNVSVCLSRAGIVSKRRKLAA